jgi:hypothetical protein
MSTFDTLADRIREEAALAGRPGQMQRLESIADEVERLRRGGKTLGEALDFWMRLAVEATGSQDCIAEDGDGDWAVVAERLAELEPSAAWDAGHRAGCVYFPDCVALGHHEPNPYATPAHDPAEVPAEVPGTADGGEL